MASDPPTTGNAPADPADAAGPASGDLHSGNLHSGNLHSGNLHDHAGTVPADVPTGILPARLSIEQIGVDAPVIDLDVSQVPPEVPADHATVGWYDLSRLPGEVGPAVLAGHIDSREGPAVFHRLDELEVGHRIVVTDADGQARTFAVVGSGTYSKEALPAEVFEIGATVPELRLITCGGVFDRRSGHYVDNHVVYAESVDQETDE